MSDTRPLTGNIRLAADAVAVAVAVAKKMTSTNGPGTWP